MRLPDRPPPTARPARPTARALALAIGLAFGCGCGGEEPVLQGVPAAPLLAPDVPTAPEGQAEDAAPPTDPEAPYRRAANVYVDIAYLGGKELDEVRDALADQLGTMGHSAELPEGGGRELIYSRGTIRVADGRIYMLRVPLPSPTQRAEALGMMGFPTQVGRALTLHREYRLNHEWDFRRIRMKRLDRESELVTEIEAWRWVPGEYSNRR